MSATQRAEVASAGSPQLRAAEPVPVTAADGLLSLSPGAAQRESALRELATRAITPLVLLAAWSVGSATGWISPQTLAAPRAVWQAFVQLLGSGVLWDNLSISLQRALLGLVLGASTGLVLGLVTGLSRTGDRLLDPTLQMLRTIPFLAVAPLLVLWFGIDEQQKLLMIALAAGFPFYLNTHGGVRSTDRKLLEAARVFGASRRETIAAIILPAALPQLLVGLRQSLGISLIALIVAEQTNSPRGIGFLMMSAQQFFQVEILLVCVALYGLWGLLADVLVRTLERVLMPWKRAAARGRA